jgi:hypothetical protein
MRSSRFAVSRRGVVFMVAVTCVLLSAGSSARQALPLEPPKESGLGVTPAFEGWFQNEDGTYSLLVGYFNRNSKQVLDIPIGPNNKIEPGGPDMGQPTHFGVRRQWGVFTIKVPADFGNKRLTWTIVANGQTASIPVGLIKDYQVEPYKDVAMGNEPPKVKFAADGKEFTGPPRNGFAATYTATVGTPLTLDAWATDDGAVEGSPAGRGGGRGGAPLRLTWHKYRGPGNVTFADVAPKIDGAAGGKTSTTATFSAPGEYVIRAQINDSTGDGGGGFQCCWTNAHIKVNVTGGPTTK